MKLLALTVLVAALGFVGGCQDTPAYTAQERFAQIGRNMQFDQQQSNDDFDSVMMLRPSDGLTIWNVYHR